MKFNVRAKLERETEREKGVRTIDENVNQKDSDG